MWTDKTSYFIVWLLTFLNRLIRASTFVWPYVSTYQAVDRAFLEARPASIPVTLMLPRFVLASPALLQTLPFFRL